MPHSRSPRWTGEWATVGDSPTSGDNGECLLPGTLISWHPRSHRAKAAVSAAKTDPQRALALLRELETVSAGMVGVLAGDTYLLQSDARGATRAYKRAQHVVELHVDPRARAVEAAALYGKALVGAATGDLWRAICIVDRAEAVCLQPAEREVTLNVLRAVRALGRRLIKAYEMTGIVSPE